MLQFRGKGLSVFESVLFKTTSSVIETEDLVVVVDPTWLPFEIAEIKDHVERIREGKELYLLFTHGDFDHIIGYGAFPDAKVIGSAGLRDHRNKQQKLAYIHQFDDEYYVDRGYDITFPVPDVVIEHDGQQLQVGKTILTFYLAPGHTNDGLFVIMNNTWIAGDYLSDFELPFIDHSCKHYVQTLEKAAMIIENHQELILVPGHGKATNERDEIKRRHHMAQSYIQRLVQAVQSEDGEALDVLGEEMPYPSSFTKECHEKNIEITKSEYGS